MDIAAMNERITFQKQETVVDRNANHINRWSDYYSCYATVSGSNSSGQSGGQGEEAGMTTDHTDLSFTVRFCPEISDMNITEYRILFCGRVYDIVSIDYMSFKRKCYKFRCRKVKR